MTDKRLLSPLRVIAVGPLPPPPGGVASSLKSLVDATQDRNDIAVKVIQWKEMWRLFVDRPDILHLHFSKPAKRLLGVFIGRLVGARVVHTIHSNNFDFESTANRIAARLAHGTILLNTDIQERFRIRGIRNCALMTPILASQSEQTEEKLDANLEAWLASRKGKITVVYSHDRREAEGQDIYGFNFVSNLLPQLHEMGWNVIFLDPFAFWRSEELFNASCPNAILHSMHVDFKLLLKRVDAYLRPTATDGNSIAVLEALSSGTPVLASDIVPRPGGVNLYRFRDASDFLDRLANITDQPARNAVPELTSVDNYVRFLSALDTMPLKNSPLRALGGRDSVL